MGAAIADRLVRGAPAAARHRTIAIGVAAANAPDLDFSYTWLTEAPLGFLLHHRGHTHTLAGAVAVGATIVLALFLWPAWRRQPMLTRPRLSLLVGLALASHLLIDASNVFGVVLWYPLSSRWVFGDTSFIFEPWLWVLLVVPFVANARRASTKTLLLILTAGPTMAAAYAGLVPVMQVSVLVLVSAIYWRLLKRMLPERRTSIALAGTIAIFGLLGGLSHLSKRSVTADLAHAGSPATILDMVREPDPAVPWCWSVLLVERGLKDAADVFRVRRGSVSLLPRVWPVTRCASYVLLGPHEGTALSSAVAWTGLWETSATSLQDLNSRDCRARGWFQFARVPMLIDGRLRDLRLENAVHENFTALEIEPGPNGCPANITNWRPPRADILER